MYFSVHDVLENNFPELKVNPSKISQHFFGGDCCGRKWLQLHCNFSKKNAMHVAFI